MWARENVYKKHARIPVTQPALWRDWNGIERSLPRPISFGKLIADTKAFLEPFPVSNPARAKHNAKAYKRPALLYGLDVFEACLQTAKTVWRISVVEETIEFFPKLQFERFRLSTEFFLMLFFELFWSNTIYLLIYRETSQATCLNWATDPSSNTVHILRNKL